MPNKKLYLFPGYLLAAILIFLMLGCGLKGPTIVELREDDMPFDSEYNSAVFWRVKVIDHTGDFYNGSPYALFTPGGEWLFFTSFIYPIEKKWEMKDGTAYFNELYYSKTQPNDLYMWRYILLGGGMRVPVDLWNMAWPIGSNSLYYLGILQIEVNGKRTDENGSTYYDISWNFFIDQKDFEPALSEFSKKYPNVFARLKNKIEIPTSYLFYEGFNCRDSNRWIIDKNSPTCASYMELDEFILVNKNDRASTFMSGDELKLPENYDITLMVNWHEGVTNQGYGIAFGEKWQDSYRFLISANRYAAMGFILDDKLQSSPSIPWTQNMGIYAPESGMPNILKVSVRGDEWSYYVNYQLIGKFKNTYHPKSWKIGVTIEGMQEVGYYLLKIEYK